MGGLDVQDRTLSGNRGSCPDEVYEFGVWSGIGACFPDETANRLSVVLHNVVIVAINLYICP